MIAYNPGKWSVLFIFRWRGSVFPKALAWAFPGALIALTLHMLWAPADPTEYDEANRAGIVQVWAGYSFVLGFLIVFRTQQAYSRWWEGGTLLQQVRGEWFNAFSSIIAFSNPDKDKYEQVEEFHHQLARLMSMLYCAALQQVSTLTEGDFSIIENAGMDVQSLHFLTTVDDQTEVIMLWIQRLAVSALHADVVNIPPPIFAQVFQGMSRGIVDLNNVKKIADFPLPFPYAQMITVMLLLHWLLTPCIAAIRLRYMWMAGVLTFVSIFAFWAINYIAAEIEEPFGDDYNDLPLQKMQEDMNTSITTLLHRIAQFPPAFVYDRSSARGLRSTIRKPGQTWTSLDSAGRSLVSLNYIEDYVPRNTFVLEGKRCVEARASSCLPAASRSIQIRDSTLSSATAGTSSCHPDLLATAAAGVHHQDGTADGGKDLTESLRVSAAALTASSAEASSRALAAGTSTGLDAEVIRKAVQPVSSTSTGGSPGAPTVEGAAGSLPGSIMEQVNEAEPVAEASDPPQPTPVEQRDGKELQDIPAGRVRGRPTTLRPLEELPKQPTSDIESGSEQQIEGGQHASDDGPLQELVHVPSSERAAPPRLDANIARNTEAEHRDARSSVDNGGGDAAAGLLQRSGGRLQSQSNPGSSSNG